MSGGSGDDGFAGPVGRTFEEGDQFPGFVGGADLVETSFVAKMEFFCFYYQQVAVPGGPCKGDRDVEGYGDGAVRIAGEGKGAVSGGEENAAMNHVKTV